MKVSVIITKIAEYERYYERAVKSVEAQVMPVQLVSVDGDHIGLARAANLGVKRADSEYVMRLDADDWLHPACCMTMAAVLNLYPDVDAVYSDFWTVDGEPTPTTNFVPPHPACMMIRRSVFSELGGYDETLSFQEGTDFWFRFIKTHNPYYLSVPLWHYRQHDRNMSKAWNKRMLARQQIKEKHMDAPKILTVIPARGGSKGIPGKNLRPLAGIPLVSHAIRLCKRSCHDMVIVVSTDSEQIAQVAKDEGVDVLMRPEALAADDVSTIPVAKHAMDTWSEWQPEIIVSVQPTDPFTPTEALDEALATLNAYPGVDSVVSVAEIAGTHPYRAYRLNPDKELHPLFPIQAEHYLQRQERPTLYGFTGGFYVRRRALLERWCGGHSGFALGKIARGVVVPPQAAVDIDSPIDLLLAESIIKHWKEL